MKPLLQRAVQQNLDKCKIHLCIPLSTGPRRFFSFFFDGKFVTLVRFSGYFSRKKGSFNQDFPVESKFEVDESVKVALKISKRSSCHDASPDHSLGCEV